MAPPVDHQPNLRALPIRWFEWLRSASPEQFDIHSERGLVATTIMVYCAQRVGDSQLRRSAVTLSTAAGKLLGQTLNVCVCVRAHLHA
eukprot:13438280-Alexandrium_andersonii.AAC.1